MEEADLDPTSIPASNLLPAIVDRVRVLSLSVIYYAALPATLLLARSRRGASLSGLLASLRLPFTK